LSAATRILIDLAAFERLPIYSPPVRRDRLRNASKSSHGARPPVWPVAADAASADRTALPTLGRLVRERRIELCSYGEFPRPRTPLSWRNTWRELLGEVTVTTIEPAISRARLGEDVFADCNESGSLVRLCSRLKQEDWLLPAAGDTSEARDVHGVGRFRRMAARVQGDHLANLFHLWSAECAGCAYWLAFDAAFEELLRERVEPHLIPPLTCQVLGPERLLQRLGVHERDVVRPDRSCVVSMLRQPHGAVPDAGPPKGSDV
jgi:hypothetical protein